MSNFGIYIIGDEILSGKRQDAHLSFVIQALKSRGLQLAWAHYLGDIPEQITNLLRASMQRGDIVFSFGGIGATPDDFTRQCAADAAGLPIARHAGAVAEIEALCALVSPAGLHRDFHSGHGCRRKPAD